MLRDLEIPKPRKVGQVKTEGGWSAVSLSLGPPQGRERWEGLPAEPGRERGPADILT